MSKIIGIKTPETITKGDIFLDAFGNVLTALEDPREPAEWPDTIEISTDKGVIGFNKSSDRVSEHFQLIENLVEKTPRDFVTGDVVRFDNGSIVTITENSHPHPHIWTGLIYVHTAEEGTFLLADDKNARYLILTA